MKPKKPQIKHKQTKQNSKEKSKLFLVQGISIFFPHFLVNTYVTNFNIMLFKCIAYMFLTKIRKLFPLTSYPNKLQALHNSTFKHTFCLD